MLLPISLFIAVMITFFSPKIPENLNVNSQEFDFYLQSGFPFQYFEGEILNVEESNYRIRAIRLYIFIISGVLSSLVKTELAHGIGTSISPTKVSIERILPDLGKFSMKDFLKIADFYDENSNKIILTNLQIDQLDIVINQVRSGRISAEEAVLQLRGGAGWGDLIVIGVFVALINIFSPEAFFQPKLPPHMNPVGWATNMYQPTKGQNSQFQPRSTNLEMEKPASMPQQEYSGLTKAERRKLVDPKGRDGCIDIEQYPRLELRYNQVNFKTPKHGEAHGLPVNDNGKTEKTEENALALRDSLINMSTNPNVVWYTNGQYQGGTEKGCDSINLFDKESNLIGVYEKQPDGKYLFLTTCKLTPMEKSHLVESNGNFVTEKVLENQKALSPINVQIQDTTNNNGIQ